MPVVDVLIAGTGVAGLSAAIKIAQRFPDWRICILTKNATADESNTKYAQGGISVVIDHDKDSIDSHIQDTLQAGDGLCNESVVEFVVSNAFARLQELVSWGIDFDRDSEGSLSLGREGGHKHNRIVHCKDSTGASVVSVLLSKVSSLSNIAILTNHAVVDLITTPDKVKSYASSCQGAVVLDSKNGTVKNFIARTTILATGGIGQLYSVTTNPLVATGDGIALARRAGARVSNMEFIQFHPTALASLDTDPCFLISEAVRGHGAHLINRNGERFMFRYHSDGELACRDVVSRAIAAESNASDEHVVYLDCAHIAHEFADKFPTIYKKCTALGLDLLREAIPVAPAAHYLCGGIEVDLRSRTTIDNLYACGECANTGLHGANRLASNSLLEALVFAHTCYLDIASHPGDMINGSVSTGFDNVFDIGKNHVLIEIRASVRKLMMMHAGIVRCNEGLTTALKDLLLLKDTVEEHWSRGFVDVELCELRNMIDVALLIVTQSLQRKENKGSYFNADIARQGPQIIGHTVL